MRSLPFAVIAAALLGGCAVSPEPPAIDAAPLGSPKPSAPVSSLKETARADRESPGAMIPYPFTTCAVIRKDLGAKAKYRRVYRNHEILLCCTPCLHAFDTNPEAYFPRIAEAAAARARGETVYSGW